MWSATTHFLPAQSTHTGGLESTFRWSFPLTWGAAAEDVLDSTLRAAIGR